MDWMTIARKAATEFEQRQLQAEAHRDLWRKKGRGNFADGSHGEAMAYRDAKAFLVKELHDALERHPAPPQIPL